jgi:CHRD domain
MGTPTRFLAVASWALAATLTAGSLGLGAASAQATPPHDGILSGAAEVPGPGSPDGTGRFSVTTDIENRTVCYELTATLSSPATAAHIHRGAVTASGPVVVPFNAPSSGQSNGCVEVDDPALLEEIEGNPFGFYVNVHNADFPDGAIRGQLFQR